MKLNRREFMKVLGIGAAGAALGRGAGVEEADELSSQVGEWTPSMLPPHEPLEPFVWTSSTSSVDCSSLHGDEQTSPDELFAALKKFPDSEGTIVVSDGVPTWVRMTDA